MGTTKLAPIDASDPQLYQDDTWHPYFERLRREDPIHYVPGSAYGPYWAVTKYQDIMHCEVHHEAFSSEIGGIQLDDQPKDLQRPSFIRMDPPRHDDQRKVASPIVVPANLVNMEGVIPGLKVIALQSMLLTNILIEVGTCWDVPMGSRASTAPTTAPGKGCLSAWAGTGPRQSV